MKPLLLLAVLAISYVKGMMIHRTSLTDFLIHEAVPSLFKNVNTDSEDFKRLAQEELNKINVAAGVPSSKPK
jgi:hypothetical protein